MNMLLPQSGDPHFTQFVAVDVPTDLFDVPCPYSRNLEMRFQNVCDDGTSRITSRACDLSIPKSLGLEGAFSMVVSEPLVPTSIP